MIRSVTLGIVLSVIIQVIPGQQPAPPSIPVPTTAIVHVKAVTTLGKDVSTPIVDIFEPIAVAYGKANRQDLAFRFRNGVASHIPVGTYHLRVRATAFYPADTFVRIYQPEVWIVVGLQLGMEQTLVAPSLSGHLAGLRRDQGPFWMKLVGVFSHFSIEGPVDNDGNFRMTGMPEGTCELLTIEGSQVVDARTVQISSSSTVINIDLSRVPLP